MENLPIWFLMTCTMTVCLIGTMLRGYVSKSISKSMLGFYVLICVSSIASAAVLFCMGGFTITCSSFTVWTGILFGTICALQLLTYSMAVSKGPVSYTTVIVSMATVIPALSGFLFWNEQLVITQIIGIVLMVACFILSVEKGKDEKKASALWFVISIISCVLSGCVGIMQKYHQSSEFSSELYPFLIISFIFSAAITAIAAFVFYKKQKNDFLLPQAKERKYIGCIFAAVAVVVGICTALNHAINLYLSGIIPAAVFFPIVNGGNLLLVSITSIIFLKERLSKKQYIGIAIGVCATVLLCI